MVMTRKYLLQVECLEERLPLNADVPEVPVEDPTDETAVQPIDETEAPVDPSNIAVTAQITALGPTVNGNLQSITVSGLAPGDQSFTSIKVQIGDTTYNVDLMTAQANGEYTLTVAAGIDPAGVSVGMEVQVIFGSGDSSTVPDEQTDPEAQDPLPPVPPIDPTTDPVY